jgi:repressor LexA
MVNKGIYDGDIVIVQRQSKAKNRDIVIVLNDKNELTLKTYSKENGIVTLEPKDEKDTSLNYEILGKLIGLFRGSIK